MKYTLSMSLDRVFERLKHGGAPRAAATYLVTSWLILEVGHILSLILEIPHVAMRFVLWLLVLGFPVVVGVAWFRRDAGPGMDIELPETEPAARAEHEIHAVPPSSGANGGHGPARAHGVDPLPFILGGMVAAALIFLGVSKVLGVKPATDESPAHATAVAAAPAAATPAAPIATANSVAVLPFDNLSGDADQAYFSDGLSEELLDALARIPSLKVAARASSFAMKARGADAATIAAKLGVSHVLDGAVRRDGQMLRVSAELVDARTGFRTWSQTYDRRMTDVFKVQQNIAADVAQALRVQLGGQPVSPAPGGTSLPAAFDAYLRGRALVDLAGSEAQYRQAVAFLDQAIAADPGYAAAWAAKARALIALGNTFLPASQIPANASAAVAAARQAVKLAPDLAEAQSTLGYTLLDGRIDVADAAAPFQRSLQLGSGSAEILLRYGNFAADTGRLAEGVKALQTAVTLDPLDPKAWRILGRGLFAAHRWADSVKALRRGLALNPGLSSAHAAIGDALLLQGDVAGAASEYRQEPIEWVRTTGQALLAARTGRPTEARRLLQNLGRKGGADYQRAQVLAQLGDRESALSALARARQENDPGLLRLGFDPWLDPLRGDPRFRALQARMGLG
ncbi:MAG TPA: tetratricopeptide repeat protein [Caulobacteraceae bacterium]|jgi:TolB-like protein/tetratricopeptide (TPR) repeat protein|nr:tetratricopeptide repeat protein [Caulobacteraceae bacterium]